MTKLYRNEYILFKIYTSLNYYLRNRIKIAYGFYDQKMISAMIVEENDQVSGSEIARASQELASVYAIFSSIIRLYVRNGRRPKFRSALRSVIIIGQTGVLI